jgi:hypothetical protein
MFTWNHVETFSSQSLVHHVQGGGSGGGGGGRSNSIALI